MIDHPTSTTPSRVVVFSARAARAEAIGAHCAGQDVIVSVRTESYAAAVDILTVKRAVLVVDLACPGESFRDLVALCQRRGHPVFGIERAVGPSDLPEHITEIEMDSLPEYIAWTTSDERRRAMRPVAVQPAADPCPEHDSPRANNRPSPIRPQRESAVRQPPPRLPQDSVPLLTRQEIDALLKRKP